MEEKLEIKTELIHKKMIDIMSDIPSIEKDQFNKSQNFKFRGIDQFLNALYPCLVKHRVYMIPSCTKKDRSTREVTRRDGGKGCDTTTTLEMTYTFCAEDGSKVTIGSIPSEGVDSGDKSTNKALSAALKYALIQTFAIPTEDMSEQDSDTGFVGQKKLDLHQVKLMASKIKTLDDLRVYYKNISTLISSEDELEVIKIFQSRKDEILQIEKVSTNDALTNTPTNEFDEHMNNTIDGKSYDDFEKDIISIIDIKTLNYVKDKIDLEMQKKPQSIRYKVKKLFEEKESTLTGSNI